MEEEAKELEQAEEQAEEQQHTPEEPERPRHTRRLPCQLTADERIDLGAQLSALVADAEELEAEKKSAASKFKAQADRIAGRMARLARELRGGTIERDIEVEIIQDIAHAEEVITRLDTGEVVSCRTLSALELRELRQTKIPGADAEPEPEPSAPEADPEADPETDPWDEAPDDVLEVIDHMAAGGKLADRELADLREVKAWVKEHPELASTDEWHDISAELSRRTKERRTKEASE